MNIAPSPDADALYARRVTLQISNFIDGSSFADRVDLIATETKLRELAETAVVAMERPEGVAPSSHAGAPRSSAGRAA